jgi:hypothetical protein
VDSAGQPATATPLDNGYFELELTGELLGPSPAITLDWVEFLR